MITFLNLFRATHNKLICVRRKELCLNVESMVEECDLDEHEALVNQLSQQRDILQEEKDKLDQHAQYLDEILSKLRGHEVNGHSLDENEIVYDQ